jgi:hypothetical protein
MRKRLPTFAAALAVSAVLASGTARADCSPGFFANVLCEAGVIDEDTANDLDEWHEDAGRPLDHLGNEAAGAAADYFVPGSGEFITEGLELRDAIRRGELDQMNTDDDPEQ